MSGSEGARLEQLCLRLSTKDDPLSRPGPLHDLATRVAAEIREGRSPSSLGDDLDRIEDLLLEAGYATGLSNSRSSYVPIPGLGGHRPALEVLACPADICTRVEAPTPDVPTCPVTQLPLRRLALGS